MVVRALGGLDRHFIPIGVCVSKDSSGCDAWFEGFDGGDWFHNRFSTTQAPPTRKTPRTVFAALPNGVARWRPEIRADLRPSSPRRPIVSPSSRLEHRDERR